ncbi:MAG: hypothetical protein ABIK90_05930, partial [candidate division WOR-3 bacterium]
FHTLLGSVNPITSLPLDGNCYLEMQVNPNPPMSPRIRIVSSAYSYIAKIADTANYAQNAPLQRPITPPISTNEISDNAITSIKILDGTIMGVDINQMGATSGQVLKWTGTTWAPANDSAGGLPSGPAGGDLTGTYPNPVIANNAVTSTKILDGTITRSDVASNFKAPYADTADYAHVAPAVDSARVAGDAHRLQGKDTSYFAPATHTHPYVDSAGGAVRVGGLDLTGLDNRFINEGQVASGDLMGTYPNPTIANNAVTSAKILDGTIQGVDINQMGASSGQVLKWTGTTWAPRNDTFDNAWVRIGSDSVLYTKNQLGIARGGSYNVLYGYYKYTHINLGVACTTGTSGSSYMYCTVSGGYRNIVSGDFATVSGGWWNKASGPYAMVGGGYNNTASGYYATVGCGQRNMASADCATVAGGYGDTASGNYAMVGGGGHNVASGNYAMVGGGGHNVASGNYATVGGGLRNTASGDYATVAGGDSNIASGYYATVSGGRLNKASDNYATVGGGYGDTASGYYATVSGGWWNKASGWSATVGGGSRNIASGNYATVAGGYIDSSAADYSFTTNNYSIVPSGYSNSAAFNGQTATASNELRCGILSKAGGSFTIDHPIDPYNKILNHYFIEGPEMLNIYSGSVVLDANGRAEVRLPDYFSSLNKNPRIQLTGVGTFEVYVIEDVKDNRFVIGGKPGVKVYWVVMGERADVSAEVIRRLMPVEQEKIGELRGRMLDDEFLSGCMEQLEREGKASGINFRTAQGRKRYEDMKRALKELEREIKK